MDLHEADEANVGSVRRWIVGTGVKLGAEPRGPT